MKSSLSYKVADSLYIVRHSVSKKAPAKPVEIPTNHIAVIDCSGSMSWDLPKIREQLKKKLPKLLREQDTISIIWFSGKKEFGVLLEAEPVATLVDLANVNKAIDRWLKPNCLTGFKEPLEEVQSLVERVTKKHSKGVFSLFFMSDGMDNCWDRKDILKTVENTSQCLASATFVEYGYYADRPLLTAMAEKAGGTLIFSEDFDRYAPLFEAAMQKKLSGAPRIEVKVDGDPIGGFAFALADGDLMTFAVTGDTLSVPEDLSAIFYLSSSSVGSVNAEVASVSKKKDKADDDVMAPAYAAVSLYSIRMRPDIVFPLLKSLGDVNMISNFSNCFGKQRYSEFMDAAKAATFGTGRFEKGWDPNKVPQEDAFTILELLQLLSKDDDNRVLLDHPDFKYSRIGRGRVDASTQLTEAEIEEIQKLTLRIAAERDVKKLKALQEQLSSITDKKSEALKFEADPAPDGYPISSLTFNEERPNVSFLVKKSGVVDISSRLPKEFKGKMPEKFKTFIYRNYAVVKDGLLNTDVLPVKLSKSTLDELNKFIKNGKASSDLISTNAGATVLNLKALPIINRKMVKATSAKTLFELEYELTKARAAQKVYNSVKKEKFPRKAEGFVVQYGEEAAKWLKEQGFTDYSGFSPKTVQAEATDFYVGKCLEVSLKGLSTLPSLKDLHEQIKKNKLNICGRLMKPHLDRIESFLTSDIYNKAADKDGIFEAWLDGEAKSVRQQTQTLIYQVAQTTFCLIVGQTWPVEFSSLDENSMTLDFDGQKTVCSMNLKEVQIKI